MPEPDNFSPVEQFQDVNKRIWNRIIREYFRDISGLEDNLDLTTPREALLKACLHKEDDSLMLTIGRMLLFLNGTTYNRDQFPLIAGQAVEEIDSERHYFPSITLYFREDSLNVEPGYQPLPMEVSWRLMNESTTTITKAKLTTIANSIKSKFGIGQGYLFKKGKKCIRYRNLTQGYDFKMYAYDTNEAKNLIREILSINGHSYDETLVLTGTIEDEAGAFPANPGTQTILGKRKNKPRKRPITNVRFRYAYASIKGYNQPIYLYSKSHYKPDALANDFT